MEAVKHIVGDKFLYTKINVIKPQGKADCISNCLLISEIPICKGIFFENSLTNHAFKNVINVKGRLAQTVVIRF